MPVCSSPCLNGGSCTAPETCTCVSGYTGAHCETLAAKSCLELRNAGFTTSDVYTIDPFQDGNPISVYCDMQYDGGGWTLIGKGRQGWGAGAGAFPTAGLGTLSDLANNHASVTVSAMPSATVQAILGGANLNTLTDGVIVHRHECAYDTFRIQPQIAAPFDWRIFYSERYNGGVASPYTASFTRLAYMSTTVTLALFSAPIDDTYDPNSNDCSRIFTANYSLHNADGGGTGWSAGSTCTGSGCWEYATERHGINRVTVFVRQ